MPTSPCGYFYPDAKSFELPPGEDRLGLENLADGGYLQRVFFDKIHLCPSCDHFHLNFRETCPACKSSDVAIVDIIHHLKCAYSGPDREFREGTKLVCPKCSRALRHIGVDYEKPTRSYFCSSCENIFMEPDTACTCINCHTTTPAHLLELVTIHSFRLTPKALRAVELGTIDDPLGTELYSKETGAYTFDFISHQLSHELSRWYRYKRDFSIGALAIYTDRSFESHYGKVGVRDFHKIVFDLIMGTLRDVDMTAPWGEMRFALLLPDTPPQGADIVMGRLKERINEAGKERFAGLAHVVDGVVSSPKDRLTVEEIFESLATQAGEGSIDT